MSTIQFSNLEAQEQVLLRRIHPDVLKLMKQYEVVVAGGAINSVFCGREVNDIDVYFKSKEQFIEFATAFVNNNVGVLECKSKKAITFRQKASYSDYKLQFVTCNWFETVQDIFMSFDFTCCMGMYNPKDKYFELDSAFLVDTATRKLRVNVNTAYPMQSVMRVLKYEKYGYTIDKAELYKLLFAIAAKCDISNWESVGDILSGFYGEGTDSIDVSVPNGTECNMNNIVNHLNTLQNTIRNYEGLLPHTPMNKEELLEYIRNIQ